MTLKLCKEKSNLRNIIIGNVWIQPEIGKKMNVIVIRSIKSNGENVKIKYNLRISTKVIQMEPIDGLSLWKVTTQSGRTYIVEVMERR